MSTWLGRFPESVKFRSYHKILIQTATKGSTSYNNLQWRPLHYSCHNKQANTHLVHLIYELSPKYFLKTTPQRCLICRKYLLRTLNNHDLWFRFKICYQTFILLFNKGLLRLDKFILLIYRFKNWNTPKLCYIINSFVVWSNRGAPGNIRSGSPIIFLALWFLFYEFPFYFGSYAGFSDKFSILYLLG